MHANLKISYIKLGMGSAAICLLAAIAMQVAALIGGSRAGIGTKFVPEDLVASITSFGWQATQLDIAQSSAEFRAVLHNLNYDESCYVRFTKDGDTFDLLVNYWTPGKMPVDKVAAHTPDACWPGRGWVISKMRFPPDLRAAGLKDPGIQYRVYEHADGVVYTIFFHKVDGLFLSYGRDVPVPLWERMIAEKWAWFGTKREQYFVRITSGKPLTELNRSPSFSILLPLLSRLGDKS